MIENVSKACGNNIRFQPMNTIDVLKILASQSFSFLEHFVHMEMSRLETFRILTRNVGSTKRLACSTTDADDAARSPVPACLKFITLVTNDVLRTFLRMGLFSASERVHESRPLVPAWPDFFPVHKDPNAVY